ADRLEVVEIEDDQRQPAVVAVRAGDLTRERLVEVATVVEARQRVEVGEGARLRVPACVLEGRAGAEGEAFELVDLLVAERRSGRVAEGADRADRGAVGAHRDDDPGPDVRGGGA